jgi:hypothetical protein
MVRDVEPELEQSASHVRFDTSFSKNAVSSAPGFGLPVFVAMKRGLDMDTIK